MNAKREKFVDLVVQLTSITRQAVEAYEGDDPNVKLRVGDALNALVESLGPVAASIGNDA